MRDYELTIIIQPELEEQPRNELLERIQGWIVPGEAEAEALKVDHWGMREMAYSIRKFKRGYYVYYEVKIDPSRITDLERNMQFTEDILRYMFVRKES
ncbi:MAG: 30S ribosomal protein S6 [Chloroflexota bacterium]|nr:30S ribosomal protein S6 [Anaerolineales bacterium]MCB8968649.1 30S ribosomal protein S6 [Ardenticatenaceae bacterium]